MENKKSSTKSKGFLSEWLEKIQQESWQLELLISGLALYGVYSGIELIEDFNTFVELNSNTPALRTIFGFSHWVLFIGWRIFFFNLLIHVILRGLWIASIGLRYVSDGIDFNELNYAPVYTKYLKEKIGTYDEFIERLEKLCSVIFAFTFLVFLLLVSLTIFISVMVAPIVYQQQYSGWGILIPLALLIYLALGLVVALDFISFGSIKKIQEPWVVKIYNPVFKFYSYLTLSFLYRPILYNFLDSKYTRKFFILAIPYVIFLGTVDSSFSNYSNPYKDDEAQLLQDGLLIQEGRYIDLIEQRIENMSSYQRKKYFNNNLQKIVLSNYHIKNGNFSLFMREDIFSLVLSNEFDKKSIKKSGALFNLFMNHDNERTNITEIEQKYLKEYVRLHKRFSQKRNALAPSTSSSELDSLLAPQKNEINKIIDSLEHKKKIEINTYKAKYNTDVFEKSLSSLSVSIDSIDYTDSLSCKYYKDPFLGADGILCNLNEVSLPKGNKILDFKQKIYTQPNQDSMQLRKIKIPVYIE